MAGCCMRMYDLHETRCIPYASWTLELVHHRKTFLIQCRNIRRDHRLPECIVSLDYRDLLTFRLTVQSVTTPVAMLKVLVVGAGIAGLTTAVSLRRAGHTVHIFERSCMNNEVGAAIYVPPNATRFLTAWGLDPVRWRFVKSRRVTIKDPSTMETTLTTSDEKTARSVGGAELYYSHRVDLHSALKWMATREDGPGRPVEIHLGSPVESYVSVIHGNRNKLDTDKRKDTSVPSITLEDGTLYTGDVVIGADGVHSKASTAVLGERLIPVSPKPYNYAYRFLINAEDLEKDPETRFWNEDREGWTRIFTHASDRRIVVYPCRE